MIAASDSRRRYFLIISVLCSFCPSVFASLPPTAVISADFTSGLAPLAVAFDASGSSADTGRTIVGYSWQFGDGGSSSGVSASHTYSGYGIFTAILTVTDDTGASDTETVVINVRNGEIFTAADINNDGVIDLADFAVLASQWLYPPEGASADIWPASVDGIVDINDLTAMTTDWLSYNDPPTAVLNCSDPNVEAGETVTFSASGSSDPQGSVLRYLWDFGDDTPLVSTDGLTVTHEFQTAGDYNVQLTVFDGDLSGTVQQIIPVATANEGGSLQVYPAALDYGPLSCDLLWGASWGKRAFSSEKFIEITNKGSGLLAVTGVYSTNPSVFKIVSGAASPLLAHGESHYIAVRFEPRVRSTDPAQSPGPRTGSIVITTTGGNQTVPLNGTVVTKGTLSDVPSPVLMGYNVLSPYSNVVACIMDFGETELATTTRNLTSVANQGGVNVTFQSAEITGPDSAHFGWSVQPKDPPLYMRPYTAGDPNESIWGRIIITGPASTGFVPYNPSYRIKIFFAPQITAPTTKQFNAKAVIHTTGGDMEIALTGKALYKPKLVIDKGYTQGFEFDRIAPGKSTNLLGTDADGEWSSWPAGITVSNKGLKDISVSMNIVDVSAGGAARFSFAPFGTMTLGQSNPSVVMTGTFSPNALGHYSAALVITPSDPNFPVDYTLLHSAGVTTATSVNILGTSESWYTVDDTDFYSDDYDFTKMIELKPTGSAGYFGDLIEIDDPFMGGTWNVYVEQWADYQNSLVMYGGLVYAIDSSVFGPYVPGDPNNTAATNTRLAGGDKIGTGGLLKTNGFLSDTDGNLDILHEGSQPLLMDIAPDGTIFYTESIMESGVVRTRLKWQKATAKGIVEENLSTRLTGLAGSEPVILRAIAGSSYRIFISFGASMYDMDLNSSHTVTATKSLTGLLSAMPGLNSRIDAAGNWVTAASDVPGHIQVFKENLHNGGKTLFAQATVPLPDTATDCQIDKLGNVFVLTGYGIYQFSPAGTAMNYILSGGSLYAENLVGSNPDGYKNCEWYMDSFDMLWFNR